MMFLSKLSFTGSGMVYNENRVINVKIGVLLQDVEWCMMKMGQ